MRLWWWRKVRFVTIRTESRDVFERFGENIIADMVSASHAPRAAELRAMYTDEKMIAEASEWLTERGDVQQQREQRLETVEWAILFCAAGAVIAEAAIVAHEYGWIGQRLAH